MPRDLSGEQFHSLTVVRHSYFVKRGSPYGRRHFWECRCVCGETTTVEASKLTGHRIKSCGCQKSSLIGDAIRTHGKTRTREYFSWQSAKRRCYDPTNPSYGRYGGRGITMAPEWRENFAAFLAHVGPRPTGHSLDRIDNDGNYEPGNVRWAKPTVQRRNQSKVKLTLDAVREIRARYAAGNRHGLCAQMSREYGILKETVHEVVHRKIYKDVA